MDTLSSDSKRFSCRLFMKHVFYGFITEYETQKIVTIHSYTITALLRFIQIILLFYSFGYLLIYKKGYQYQDTSIISSVTLKVKGIGYVNKGPNDSYVFDGTDYIIPPSENNAIFIMTNFIETEQSRSTCVESPAVPLAFCKKDSDCQKKPDRSDMNGRWTGRCSAVSKLSENKTTNSTQRLCEIQGWCPVEDDRQKPTIIQDIPNFTIFLKNFMEFPTFNVKHKNIGENLKSCVYDPLTHPDCPIFRLSYILNEAEKNVTERELMLLYGAVIRVKLDWDCNLDRNIKSCKPVYSFARLDTPFHEETFSVGFNFRFASHWKYKRSYRRSLRKAYGLRFIISVSGKAGKFDFITLTLNTGSLVGIFGLASFVCDYILLNLSKKAAVYREQVFQRFRSRPASMDQSVLQLKPRKTDASTIFQNPSATEREVTPVYHLSESPQRIHNLANRSLSSSVLGQQNRMLGFQANLGLTNPVN
ncbi:unnamed protein product [Adineta ricciae]|uniref:P2X purinoceptor n=1 Tax=Adineta ricciae TaxID=249248 RepID=A0A815B4Q6_ADIRI|nr:unnamed protein product [Adineta ricciae]